MTRTSSFANERLREYAAEVDNSLRRVIQRQRSFSQIAVWRAAREDCAFRRGDVCLVELDGALAKAVSTFPRWLSRRFADKRGENFVGSLSAYIWVATLGFSRAYVARTASAGRLSSLERVRYSKCDVLAVVANDIILERWTPLSRRLRTLVQKWSGRSLPMFSR